MSHPIVLACRVATDEAVSSSGKLLERMAEFDFQLRDHLAVCRDAIGHSREVLAKLVERPGGAVGRE